MWTTCDIVLVSLNLLEVVLDISDVLLLVFMNQLWHCPGVPEPIGGYTGYFWCPVTSVHVNHLWHCPGVPEPIGGCTGYFWCPVTSVHVNHLWHCPGVSEPIGGCTGYFCCPVTSFHEPLMTLSLNLLEVVLDISAVLLLVFMNHLWHCPWTYWRLYWIFLMSYCY
jgi:hypothetical protein